MLLSNPQVAPAIVAQPAAAEPARGEIAVQCLSSAGEFAQLAPVWNRLHAQAQAATVFNAWIWQYQWWQIYGRGQPLRVLTAIEGGRTVGIVALYVQSVKVLGVRVRVLRFVGTGGDTHPDDLGPILERAREDEIALKLAQAALQVPEVDAIVLTDIAPQSVFAQAVQRAATEAGEACLRSDGERIAFVELPRTWPDFLASLNSNRRRLIRGARRKAEAAHEVRFYVWDDSMRLNRAVDRLVELHRRRWLAAGGASESFATREYVEFHRRTIQSTFARGWLRLYCLELDGELAAITYCYRFRDRVYMVQAGFDPELARHNPGRVLLGYALEHAIAEGNQVFDFLRGEHRYKNQLATGHRRTQCVRVFRRSAAGFAYRLRRVWLPLIKAKLLGRPAPKLRP